MKRILVVKIGSLGSVVLAAPAFAALRRAYPGAWITLLTSPPIHEVLKTTGWANEVFAYNPAALDRQPLLLRWIKDFRIAQELRSRKFDLALDLQGSRRSARLVKSSGAALQAGLDLPETRGFYHVRAQAPDHRTASIRELDNRVMRFAGVETTAPENWPVPEEAEREAGRFFVAHGIADDDMTVALNPFASRMTREWHPWKWGETASELDSVGIRVFFTCAPMERKRMSGIEAAMSRRLPVYAGASLLPLLGLYRRCRAVVSCDAGPRHLAAAVGTPTLTVWGPESASRRHPYDPGRHPIVARDVPCRPCGLSVCIERNHECMVGIRTDDVLKELKRLLRENEPKKVRGRKFDKTA